MTRLNDILFPPTFALAISLLGALPAVAQDMAVSSSQAVGSTNSELTLSATPLHALGPTQVSLVAFELTNGQNTWNSPPANDSGTNGDLVADDGIWSITTSLAGAEPGAYSMKVYVVDTAGSEFLADPVDITLN